MFGFAKQSKGRRVIVRWPNGVYQEWALSPGDHVGVGDDVHGRHEVELKLDDAGVVEVALSHSISELLDAIAAQLKMIGGHNDDLAELTSQIAELKKPVEIDTAELLKQVGNATLLLEVTKRVHDGVISGVQIDALGSRPRPKPAAKKPAAKKPAAKAAAKAPAKPKTAAATREPQA